MLDNSTALSLASLCLVKCQSVYHGDFWVIASRLLDRIGGISFPHRLWRRGAHSGVLPEGVWGGHQHCQHYKQIKNHALAGGNRSQVN